MRVVLVLRVLRAERVAHQEETGGEAAGGGDLRDESHAGLLAGPGRGYFFVAVNDPPPLMLPVIVLPLTLPV